MFKKVTLFIVLAFLLIISNNFKKETQLVYSETANQDYRQIYLLFESNNLNTNNFNEYFNDIEVLKIYPYINPIYAGKVRANYNYAFNSDNYNYELERFKNRFIKILKNIGLSNESNYYQTRGVIIRRVLVYEDLENIKNIFKNFDNVKYSNSYNGIYYDI